MIRSTSLFSLLALVAIVGCDKSQPPAPGKTTVQSSETKVGDEGVTGTVRASGSSALQPLINAAREKFEKSHSGVSVEVSAGGSKKGLADVESGAVHLGSSDIDAPGDMKDLVDHRVAVVGFATMGHKGAYNEAVHGISKENLAKVFRGQIKDWKELGGKPQPIVVINRAAGSGTRAVFGKIILGGDDFVESRTEDNSGALVAKLEQTEGAISYLALSFAGSSIRTFGIEVDGKDVEPTEENITTGKYPLWSYEHVYTKGAPTGATKLFIDYLQSPDFQEHVLPAVKGFIPATKMKVKSQP